MSHIRRAKRQTKHRHSARKPLWRFVYDSSLALALDYLDYFDYFWPAGRATVAKPEVG